MGVGEPAFTAAPLVIEAAAMADGKMQTPPLPVYLPYAQKYRRIIGQYVLT